MDILLVLPFVVLLLCIALLPVVAEHFWHSNFNKGLVSIGLSVPVVIFLIVHQLKTGEAELTHAIAEYVDFIVPLTALYVIAGGIVVQGDIRSTPLANTLLLAIGAVLANLVGTTGASMLLIQPVLRINKHRASAIHVPIFFIFIVGNTGGLLTPVGDPPLLLGYLHGVDFFWTLSLWPHWLITNGLILAVFFVWDMLVRRSDDRLPTSPPSPPKDQQVKNDPPQPIRLAGLVNLPLLVGILATIVLQVPRPWNTSIMALLTWLSWTYTPQELRRANRFGWEAILEVGILFLGIFITMVPALHLLETHGRDLGLKKPWHFFWSAGGLSAFLDNAPTYLTFATVAGGSQRLRQVMVEEPLILQAISCGAVFLGALTYVGNAPNFMIKAIAENAGYRMPSFFAYLLRASLVLLPIYAAVSCLFFLKS